VLALISLSSFDISDIGLSIAKSSIATIRAISEAFPLPSRLISTVSPCEGIALLSLSLYISGGRLGVGYSFGLSALR
jgi:hypothetical protein